MGTLRCLIKEGVKIKGGELEIFVKFNKWGVGGGVGGQNKRGGGLEFQKIY